MYALGTRKDVHEKIQQELDEHLSKNEQEYQYEDLVNLPYLNCFIKESLRYYPIVYAVPSRMNVQDENILGHHVPKGTTIIINTIGLHFSPDLWDEPNEFRPERFLEEKTIKTASWLPFGMGSHLCLGKNFSLFEQAVFLAMLLKDYDVEVNETLRYAKTIFLTPEKYTLCLKPRNNTK